MSPPQAKSQLNIPAGTCTVSVKILDTVSIAKVPADALFAPPISGIKHFKASPAFSFLIEHPSNRKVLFDLGVAKNLAVLGAEISERLKSVGHQIEVRNDVADELEVHGIGRDEIEAVIWSHTHWDHKGDMSTFGPSTDLVLGPDTIQTFMNGDGNSRLGGINPQDVKGRTVREISFEGPSAVKIGRFNAFDYFADGSLYLLDAPGHSVGHLCALARTTTGPDTFMFLGGDTAHHCAEYRPSAYVPLPASITPDPTTGDHNIPYCPGSWFEDINVERGRQPHGPIYQPSWAHNMEQTMQSIEKLQEADGDENVLVVIAHDSSIRSPDMPFFPKAANDWKERGLGQNLKWSWIGDVKSALADAC